MSAYEKYLMFDSTETDTRSYTAADFAGYFSQMFEDGVVHDADTALKVIADGTERAVRVKVGTAFVKGYRYELAKNAASDADFSVAVTAAGSSARTDAIMLRLNLAADARTLKLVCVKGNSSAPAPVRTGTTYDIVLAHVRVPANATVITAANVTDKRADETLCGWCFAKRHLWPQAGETVSADNVTAGTLAGLVEASAGAQEAIADAQVRSVSAGTQALTAGVSDLQTGTLYFQYE